MIPSPSPTAAPKSQRADPGLRKEVTDARLASSSSEAQKNQLNLRETASRRQTAQLPREFGFLSTQSDAGTQPPCPAIRTPRAGYHLRTGCSAIRQLSDWQLAPFGVTFPPATQGRHQNKPGTCSVSLAVPTGKTACNAHRPSTTPRCDSQPQHRRYKE